MSESKKNELKINIDAEQERQKPRLVAILLFDFASQTNEGKQNILGIFDRVKVSVDKKRTPPIGFYLKTAHTFDDQIQVAILSPENQLVAGFFFGAPEKERDGKKLTQMQILGIVEFDTPMAGEYWIDVSYKEQSLGGFRLVVDFVDTKEEGDGSK